MPRVPYKSTKDPIEAAQNQRDVIQSQGDELNAQNDQDYWQSQGRAQDYDSFLDPVAENLAAGGGGYTDEEKARIYQDGREGENYLTPEEQRAASGDTASWGKYFSPEAMEGAQADSAALQRGAAQHLRDNVNAAVNPDQLRQSGDYRARSRQSVANNKADTWNTIQANAGNVRGAIDSEGQNVRGAIEPNAVSPSESFLQDYNMSPEEQQRIVESAGISAGQGYRAATGEAQRRALAAGSSPMGVAAYRARMERQAAADAGDAMTKARVAADEAAANRKLTGEQLRENAGKYLTDTKVNSELQLGNQRQQAEQNMGSQAIQSQMRLGEDETAQANAEEANRQQAEQNAQDTGMKAAQIGGQAELDTERGINDQQRQVQQFNTSTGTNLAQGQDTASANRAYQMGANRQGVSMQNQQNNSQRAQTVGNARIGQQNTGLGIVQNQSQTQNQNAQNARNRQQQTYATQSGATNQATAIGAQADAAAKSRPSTFDKVMGGISGGLSAAASFLDEGGVVTEPTVAVLGEHGPEAVVPLDYRAKAKTRPSMASGLATAAGAIGGAAGKPSPMQGLGKNIGGFLDAYKQYRTDRDVKRGFDQGDQANTAAIDQVLSTSPNRPGQVAPPLPTIPQRRRMYGEAA